MAGETMGDASRAYADGVRAGQADRAMGWRSRYIWATVQREGFYLWHYSRGYRAAQLGRE